MVVSLFQFSQKQPSGFGLPSKRRDGTGLMAEPGNCDAGQALLRFGSRYLRPPRRAVCCLLDPARSGKQQASAHGEGEGSSDPAPVSSLRDLRQVIGSGRRWACGCSTAGRNASSGSTRRRRYAAPQASRRRGNMDRLTGREAANQRGDPVQAGATPAYFLITAVARMIPPSNSTPSTLMSSPTLMLAHEPFWKSVAGVVTTVPSFRTYVTLGHIPELDLILPESVTVFGAGGGGGCGVGAGGTGVGGAGAGAPALGAVSALVLVRELAQGLAARGFAART
jgi:hypothetical protein